MSKKRETPKIRNDGKTPPANSQVAQPERSPANPVWNSLTMRVQTKSASGNHSDSFEEEADRVAEHIVRLPEPVEPHARPFDRATVFPGRKEETKEVPAGTDPGDISPLIAAAGLPPVHGAGRPLAPDLRNTMERHFGRVFQAVRVHTDDQADASARAAGALAFTRGTNVVFRAGQYSPGTPTGQRLLAHELTHVVQQSRPPGALPGAAPGFMTAGLTVRRAPAPNSPAQLQDPISGYELPEYGFFAVGPDFSGPPTEADVRQVLGETGVMDVKTLGECVISDFQLKLAGGNHYFAYIHPVRGVVARAYGSFAGYTISGGKKQSQFYSVFAYVSNKDATKYRPVGGTGILRHPTPALDVMAGAAPTGFADLYASLKLIDERLAALAKRYPPQDPILGGSIVKAQGSVVAIRTSLVASPAQAQAIQQAIQLLEWMDYDLTLIDQQRQKLLADSAPTVSVDALRKRYGAVFEKLLEAGALAAYEEAQLWAERLPIDVLLDALKAHGNLNKEYLVDSATLVDWVDDLRKRLTDLYAKRQQLLANPANATLAQEVQNEAAFLEAAVRGIQLFAQHLVAFEQFIKNRPGVLDTPLIDAMNRLRDRVHAIKAAYDAHDAKRLKALVDALEADENIKTFYRALPAAMQVTQLIGRIGVTTLAALATGGVGGLLSGGARAAATGITVRGALTFAGTAVLEAATFTAVSAGASAIFFGDKITFGSLLKDFAWNLGLFFVLRGVSGVSTVALRAAELQVLSTPVQLTASFPFAHAWGVIRFLIEQNRWPTKDELDRMTAESVILLAGIALGSKSVQRWVEASKQAKSMSRLYREYGWRFEALETLRTELGGRVKKAEEGGKGNDQAELEAAKAQAEKLEKSFQDLLKAILEDKRFQVPQIREELNALRQNAPDVAAEILTEVLGIPFDVGLHRAGQASYTYSNGKTTVLEEGLRANYIVTKTTDAKTGLKTVTATSPKAPTLVFQERSAGALSLDPGVYDVQKLMLDFSVTSPEAQKMLWRLLSENGIARNAKQATTTTRKQVKDLMAKTKKSAEELLQDMYKTGRLHTTAPKALQEVAARLEKNGILQSAEWLEARGEDMQRGVIGEWLAKEAAPSGSGVRTLRRVTVQADLFEDPAGKVPAKDKEGTPRVNVTPVETDLIYAREVSGTFEVDTVINVKTSGEKGMAKSAAVQNENFSAVLKAKPGDLIKLKLADGVRYARVNAVTAYDGAVIIDLTGKLKPGGAMVAETVGPKGAGGFTKSLPQDRGGIATVAKLLAELQLVRAGEY
jgi:hypothetical protein